MRLIVTAPFFLVIKVSRKEIWPLFSVSMVKGILGSTALRLSHKFFLYIIVFIYIHSLFSHLFVHIYILPLLFTPHFLLMDVYIQERSGQSNCTHSTHTLTHSILINLFIKLELNNFLLPPLLSIVFVQECSVVSRKVFDEGRLERRTFLPEK